LAIIRTGIFRGSGYEVHQHKNIAHPNGIPYEKIEALEVGSSSTLFSAIEKLVLKFTEEFVLDNKASSETFSALTVELGNRQVAELAITVGYYMLISSFLETFEVDIEQGEQRR
jgi:alkylhydroperoxidase family enzyme